MTARTGLDPLREFADEIAALTSDGLIEVDRAIRPTGAGLLVLDRVIGEFATTGPTA